MLPSPPPRSYWSLPEQTTWGAPRCTCAPSWEFCLCFCEIMASSHQKWHRLFKLMIKKTWEYQLRWRPPPSSPTPPHTCSSSGPTGTCQCHHNLRLSFMQNNFKIFKDLLHSCKFSPNAVPITCLQLWKVQQVEVRRHSWSQSPETHSWCHIAGSAYHLKPKIF